MKINQQRGGEKGEGNRGRDIIINENN